MANNNNLFAHNPKIPRNSKFTPYDLKAVSYWQPMANKLACQNASLRLALSELKSRFDAITCIAEPPKRFRLVS